MKKVPLLVAMLALVLVAAVPAMGVEDVSAGEDACVADNELATAEQAGLGNIDDSCTDTITTTDQEFDQEFEQDHFESGDIKETDEVDVAGDNNDVCAPSQSTNNTGNTGNQQGITVPSDFDDAELSGDASEWAPEQATDCAAS